jgi:hypothetical protein
MLLDKLLDKEEITGIINATFPLPPQEKNGLRQVLDFLHDHGYDMQAVLLGRSAEGGATLLTQAMAWDSLNPVNPSGEQQAAYRFMPDAPFPALVAVVLEMAARTFDSGPALRSFISRQYFGHTARNIAENAVDQGVDTNGIYRGIVRVIDHFERMGAGEEGLPDQSSMPPDNWQRDARYS